MTTVVRVCEATYDSTLVVKEGIQVLVSFEFQTSDVFMTVDHQTQGSEGPIPLSCLSFIVVFLLFLSMSAKVFFL